MSIAVAVLITMGLICKIRLIQLLGK